MELYVGLGLCQRLGDPVPIDPTDIGHVLTVARAKLATAKGVDNHLPRQTDACFDRASDSGA
jgi:hypothetical protein